MALCRGACSKQALRVNYILKMRKCFHPDLKKATLKNLYKLYKHFKIYFQKSNLSFKVLMVKSQACALATQNKNSYFERQIPRGKKKNKTFRGQH